MANAEDQLRKFFQDIAEKENYASSNINIEPFTSAGANYTTDLYLATIQELSKPNIYLFAKVANLSKDARTNNEFLSSVYATEGVFYTELMHHFERIYSKHQVPTEDRLIIPKYYGHVAIPYEEVLVLENLEAKGFANFDRMTTFNWEYAATAVTELAKFHALGLALREENLVTYEKLTSGFQLNFFKDQEKLDAFMQKALQNLCEGLNNDYKQRLLNFVSSIKGMMSFAKQMLQSESFLLHGDFKLANLMHRRVNGKLEIVPVDYQTLRLGNPIADLMYFIFSGSDEEFRRVHYQRLLEHYFAQLTLALRNLNIDVEAVYSQKTFEKDLIRMRPLGLIYGIFLITIVTVAPEDAPKFDADVSSMQLKPNKLALERFSGIVRDYVRWGVL